MAGFKVALVENHGASDLGTDGGVKDILPKLEASYILNAGAARIKFVGGISTFKVDPDGIDESVTSGMLGASVKFPAGPVTLAFNGWGGLNVGTLGMYHQGVDDPVFVDGNKEDTTSWGGIALANFKAMAD